MDAVASRVQSAVSMQRVTKDMTQVVRSMEGALKSMNLEQISSMLDRFEKSFENLDVQSQVMEETVGGITAQSVPEASVQVTLTYLRCLIDFFILDWRLFLK